MDHRPHQCRFRIGRNTCIGMQPFSVVAEIATSSSAARFVTGVDAGEGTGRPSPSSVPFFFWVVAEIATSSSAARFVTGVATGEGTGRPSPSSGCFFLVSGIC